MMKKYLLKIVGLLFLCAMVFSCEKDNFVDDFQKLDRQNDLVVKIIGEKEIKANKKLSDILQQLKNPTKDYQGREIHSSEYGFTVYTERAKYAETDSTHSYSFYISMDNPEDNNLKNLVLSSNENEGYDVFVVHYALASDEFENVDIEMLKAAPHTVTRLEEFDYGDILPGNPTARQVYACIAVYAIVEVYIYEGEFDGDCCETNYEEVLIYSDCGFYDNGSGGGGSTDGGNTGDSGSTGGGSDTGGGDGDGTGAPYNGESNNEIDPDNNEIDPDIVIVVPVLEPEEDCNTSKEDLVALFPNANEADMQTLANVLNDYGADFGIDTEAELQHFLAQTGHETGGFTTLNVTESTYWTTASLLAGTYSKFTMDSTAAANDPDLYYAPDYMQDSEGVANVAMCCQNGNGNVSSGDGYKYRGRGIVQLTWHDNYLGFQTWYNNEYDPDIDVVTNPGLIANDKNLSILSGLWYFKERVLDKETITESTSADVATRQINKYTDSYQERRDKLNEAKTEIECVQE